MKHGIFSNPVLIMFCLASLFFGGIMFYLGIEQYNEVKSRPETYEIIPGTLVNYNAIEETGNGTKYRLVYVYCVNQEEYFLYTTAITDGTPTLYKQTNLYYDTANPTVAEIAYEDNYAVLILIGAVLCLVPAVFILAFLITSGAVSLSYISLSEVLLSIVFIVFSLVFNFVCCGSLSPIEAIKAGGIYSIFSMLFLGAGLFLLFKGLFFKKFKNQ